MDAATAAATRPAAARPTEPAAGPAAEIPAPVPAAGRRRRPDAAGWLIRAAALAAAAAAWQLLTTADVTFGLRFDRLPSPAEVAGAFAGRLGSAPYYLDLAQSVLRILTGFVLAALAGVAAGVLVARSRRAGDLLLPVLEIVRPIPAIALVPIAILVFPRDEQGIVFITFAAAFFPIMVSTRHAVRALPTSWEDAVRTMGGGRARVLANVILPGALPGVFGGLSVGMGVAWICVISAEMISGEFGVGYRTWHAYTVVDYPGVIVGMATIGAIGWLASAAIELLGRRLTRWLPRGGGRP
ncbi:putative nitrate ABC transporter, permease protein [Sphaerisporangium rufum]|uniref:Nitrate ABC transporter, permease protein n=1 Tax=Sphaerisporangium rufum TaxID=1381558 RepID=A0A919QWE1_9ACTN|nr:ABC transporter permease [Sphaerisporangium rufum]GII75336.1 putative nitrate ABC transporter, permease protein [Sphaerisporangium rufum]